VKSHPFTPCAVPVFSNQVRNSHPFLSFLFLSSFFASSYSPLHLKETSEVYSVGKGDMGQLGLGTNTLETSMPVRIERLRDYRIQSISTGMDHVLMLTDDGRVLSWGWGHTGQLGLGEWESSFEPRELPNLEDIGSRVVRVVCGLDHSFLLTEEGKVWAFGK
jgi:alpha-tubulin suppressor-like RCC1 family protein